VLAVSLGAQAPLTVEAFLMREVFAMFKQGDVLETDLRSYMSDKRARDQARQLLMMMGTEASVEVLWQDYHERGEAETREYLTGAIAGVYAAAYRDFLIKIVKDPGKRQDNLNAEVNALIVLGMHSEELARKRLVGISAQHQHHLLSETAARSLRWMRGEFYSPDKEPSGSEEQREIKMLLHRFFGTRLNFSPLVFNKQRNKVFLNFSARGEGYNALLCEGPRGWYIAGVWFRYIV